MSTAALLDAGGWPGLLSQLFQHDDLSAELAGAAFDDILSGGVEPLQIAAFLAALRTKGETVEEMAAFVRAMRRAGEVVVLDRAAIDTCGTGGDRSGTINVSTVAALICAGAGVAVCKHGNRAASSQAGSADVLEALGVAIDLGPAGVARCVAEAGIGFCLAPRFHPAMRHVGPVRSGLGVATVFNFLGPLANPAAVRRQVVGVGDPRMAEKMLGVLEANGAEHAIVCYGEDGLDELSTTAPSVVLESRLDGAGGRVRDRYLLDARDLGLAHAERSELAGGDPELNAARLVALLGGEEGPQRDIVCLNAAAALYVAGAAADLAAGVALARESLDSGRAASALHLLVEHSQAAHAAALA
ncbi:MAG TPA: anthranilate phosphoribosyltransferase [Acidimicrobiales bacterium]|nr:anthranilate phosphoribosyltransferase [Acidimicrobiales bacterium]